jgi:uncharacterized protein YceK
VKAHLLVAAMIAALLSGCSGIPGTDPTSEGSVIVNGNPPFTTDGIEAVTNSQDAVFDGQAPRP